MGVKGRTPEKRGKGLTFTHDRCHGKARVGWLSGDVHCLECHVGENEKSKPCERVLLGNSNAPCPGCEAKRPIETLGYVPLRDQTGKPVCVIVRKERIQFVANMDPGTAVQYGRDEGRYESVYVIPRMVDQKWDRYFSHPPNDEMGYWLPPFLGVPHLAAAMRAWFAGECQPVVTPADSLPPAELLPGDAAKLPAVAAGVFLDAQAVGGEADRRRVTNEQFAQAARNGKHVKKKG